MRYVLDTNILLVYLREKQISKEGLSEQNKKQWD
jgi:hypothetical protein